MTRREDWPRDPVGVRRPGGGPTPTAPLRLQGLSPPDLPARPVVNDLMTPPLVEGPELDQILCGSIAAEQTGPELTEADRQLLLQRLECFRAEAEHGIDSNDALGANEKLV